jgi:diazepam-binding inhibitor (GABA receptor modulator, acyl-CoA-binding protein)
MSNKIEDNFNLAANYIQSNHEKFNKNELLKFYAFYKQSTVGAIDPATQSRPSFFKIQERAKFDAWNALGSMDKDQAMKSYIELLTSMAPKWSEETGGKMSSGSFGPCVSRPKFEEFIDDSEKSIEDFIRAGNVDRLKKLLSDIDPNELNLLDDNGLGLIHWSRTYFIDQRRKR